MKLIILFLTLLSLSSSQFAMIHGESNLNFVQDVAVKLFKYFNVSIINAKSSTPVYADLAPYSAIMAWPDGGFLDSVALGSVLKQYVDSGRGLILAMFVFSLGDTNHLRGDWPVNYYVIVPNGTWQSSGEQTLVPLIPDHPILAGVKSFDGGSSSYRGGAWSSGALQVAQWTDGFPLVGVKQIGNATRVDLGMFPPSSDARTDFWQATTDGARLMANALNFVLSGQCGSYTNCKSCAASSTCEWCLDSDTCVPLNSDCPDNIQNPSDCPVTCAFATCSSCVDPSQQGACTWCLDLKECVLHSQQNTCHGFINNKKFCPTDNHFN